MLTTITTAGLLACGSILAGCAADTRLSTSERDNVAEEDVHTGETESTEGMETTGEVQEDLTQWQKVCVLGCTTFAGAGCAAVGVSCTAGALWTFGGILIPCGYAVIAACAGATSVITVCGIKCLGG